MNTKALRQKILDLAIHGKLVPQNPKDESATVLLEKIRAEKDEKIKQGELKANKKDSFIFVGSDKRHYEQFADGTVKDIEDEIPFDVPEGWAWCRLGNTVKDIADIDHKMPEIKEEGIPFISPIDFTKDGKIDFQNAKKISKSDFERLSQKIKPSVNDIIFPRYGTIGVLRLVNSDLDFLVSYSCATIVTDKVYSNPKYIYYALQTSLAQSEINKYKVTTTQSNIGIKSLKQFFIPLAPLAEQQCIVSSIESIFAQIDMLEQNKSNLETAIKQAKSKILDLAIHGKLVPQDPNDEPAEELLKRIVTSDNRPYKKFEDEVPFEIPENWGWCTGNDIFNPMTSKKPYGETFRYIDIDAIDNKKHCVIQPKTIAVSEAPSRASRELNNGDVLFSLVRPYLENIALIEKENTDCIASTGFYVCKPKDFIFPKFLFYLMTSEYVIKGLNQFMKGDNSPSINGDDIKNWLYPLPPLAEQQRIVTKIEELFKQLDSISEQLA